MTILKEYIEKIEIIKKEIIDCDNLMEFYHRKKIELLKQLDKMEKMEISEDE